MALSNASKAGVAIFVGAVQFSISVILGEIDYSAYGTGGYNVSTNSLSDLGVNCPSVGPCYVPPSSTLWTSSIIILGILLLVGAYYLQRAFRWKPGASILMLTGVGSIGVGVFPASTGAWHLIFELIAFLFAGLSGIVLARFQRKPMSYLSVILGLATLVVLVLRLTGYDLGLGSGGAERMVLYPALLWGVGFGGYLMATEEPPRA